jgi:hypothetical protein
MSGYREESERVKQERLNPAPEIKQGNQMKKKLSKSKRGEWKIRMNQIKRGLEKPEQWIHNHYRDEASALGALRNLGPKFAFYFIEVLNPVGKVIADNREAYEARRLKFKDVPPLELEDLEYKIIQRG